MQSGECRLVKRSMNVGVRTWVLRLARQLYMQSSTNCPKPFCACLPPVQRRKGGPHVHRPRRLPAVSNRQARHGDGKTWGWLAGRQVSGCLAAACVPLGATPPICTHTWLTVP